MIDRWGDIPYAKEVDFYVDGESSLELHAQSKTFSIIPGIHGVRERQLFLVAWREKSDFLKHASEGTCCESTTRETENRDSIPGTI